MRNRGFLPLLVGVSIAAACSGDSFPQVSDAIVGMPTGPNAALYLTVDGFGDGDRLIGARTEVAQRVELHETVTDPDATMSMNPVEGFDLPADGEGDLVLAPGGAHLMLVDVERLDVGERVEMTLTFERVGDVAFVAEVAEPHATTNHDG